MSNILTKLKLNNNNENLYEKITKQFYRKNNKPDKHKKTKKVTINLKFNTTRKIKK